MAVMWVQTKLANFFRFDERATLKQHIPLDRLDLDEPTLNV